MRTILRAFSLPLLAVCIAATGCERKPDSTASNGTAPPQATEPVPLQPPSSQAQRLEPFVQRIDGTTVEFTMVPIEAGEARSDVPDDPEPVKVEAFYIGQTEVTWDLFDIFVYGLDIPDADKASDAVTRPSKPYVPPDRGFGHAGYPAISMTHQSAQKFCEWLSAKTGRTYRLPTETEWALVAQRCDSNAALDEHEWYRDNADAQTHEVGTKSACTTGVHDLFGNAAEWTVGLDGKPIVCGGAYSDDAGLVSGATRRKQTSAWNMSDPQMPKSKWWLPDAPFVGFRLVCEIEQGETDAGEQKHD